MPALVAEMEFTITEDWSFWTLLGWATITFLLAFVTVGITEDVTKKGTAIYKIGYAIFTALLITSAGLLVAGVVFVPYNLIYGKETKTVAQTRIYPKATQIGESDQTPKNTSSSANAKKDPLVQPESATPSSPKKQLTPEEKFAGTYEKKNVGQIYRYVFLENGAVEGYQLNYNANIWEKDYQSKWKIVDEDGSTAISRINPDRSYSDIAYIVDGKRIVIPKESQPARTYKKIK